MVALPLAADGAEGAETGSGGGTRWRWNQSDDGISNIQSQENRQLREYVDYRVGWISDASCVFIVSECAAEGPHKDASGIARVHRRCRHGDYERWLSSRLRGTRAP